MYYTLQLYVIRGQLQFATVERNIIIRYIVPVHNIAISPPRVSVCALFAARRSAVSLYCDLYTFFFFLIRRGIRITRRVKRTERVSTSSRTSTENGVKLASAIIGVFSICGRRLSRGIAHNIFFLVRSATYYL